MNDKKYVVDYPEVIKEWNYEKNTISPNEITAGSNKKVWWKFSKCGNEWQATIYNRTHETNCPNCGKNK